MSIFSELENIRARYDERRADGGVGSGNFGHRGRPGEVGGSAESAAGHTFHLRAQTTKKTKSNPNVVDTSRPPLEKAPSVSHGILSKVRKMEKEKGGIYDSKTEKPVKVKDGYLVTFHQNLSLKDPYGRYDEKTYDEWCDVMMKETGSDTVYIDTTGTPKAAFLCKNQEIARRLMREFNQTYIYDASARKEFTNFVYDAEHNMYK